MFGSCFFVHRLGTGWVFKKSVFLLYSLAFHNSASRRGLSPSFCASLKVDWCCLLLSVILVLGHWSVLCCPSLALVLAGSVCLAIELVFSHIHGLPSMGTNSALSLSLVLHERQIPDEHLLYTCPTEQGCLTPYPDLTLSHNQLVEACWKNLMNNGNSPCTWTCSPYHIVMLALTWPL